jgi:nucleoside-diphosphate-sugar epimerase
LPLGAVRNRRSLVGLHNLVDALIVCLDHPAAAGRAFLVSDGEDVSTPDLVRALARALGVRARILACPAAVLRVAATLTGRRDEFARLAGSLQVDATSIRRDLGWHPPHALAQGLAETARWYHAASGA